MTELHRYHVAGYYAPGARTRIGKKIMKGGEFAFQLNTNSESQLQMEKEILEKRSDIGRVEVWETP